MTRVQSLWHKQLEKNIIQPTYMLKTTSIADSSTVARDMPEDCRNLASSCRKAIKTFNTQLAKNLC